MLPREVFLRVSPSIFIVECLSPNEDVISSGSGVVVRAGHLVTNSHVVRESSSVRVRRGVSILGARVEHSDPKNDLCELAVERLDAPCVSLRESPIPAVGERVYAVGAPKGLELTISEGIISSIRERKGTAVIQNTAPISPGSSGGGLFDEDGLLAGITTYSVEGGQSLNFALPANLIPPLEGYPAEPASSRDDEMREHGVEHYLRLAAEKISNEDYAGAVVVLRTAIKDFGENELLWHELGLCYCWLGLYEESLRANREAVRLDPDCHQAWLWIGHANFGIRDFDSAITAYKKAIRLREEDVFSWGGLGDAYMGKCEYKEALGAYEKAVELQPEDGSAICRVARAQIKMKQYDRAVETYQKATALDPKNPSNWFGLAYGYFVQGASQRLFQTLSKLEAMDPERARQFERDYLDR